MARFLQPLLIGTANQISEVGRFNVLLRSACLIPRRLRRGLFIYLSEMDNRKSYGIFY